MASGLRQMKEGRATGYCCDNARMAQPNQILLQSAMVVSVTVVGSLAGTIYGCLRSDCPGGEWLVLAQGLSIRLIHLQQIVGAAAALGLSSCLAFWIARGYPKLITYRDEG